MKSKDSVNLAKPKGAKVLKRTIEGLPKPDAKLDTTGMDPELVEKVEEVAKLAVDKKKQDETKSALLGKLKGISKISRKAKEEDEVVGESMSSLFSDIKVEKSARKQKDLTAEQREFIKKRNELRMQRGQGGESAAK